MSHPRILVVDDDDLFLKSIRKELDRGGYPVRTASCAQEALAELRSFPPDVVLLDVRLPDKNGVELLRIIKDRDPSTEVIMLTAYGSINAAIDSLRSGAYHYLVKPAKLSEIEALIHNAHERKTLRIENRVLKEELQSQPERDVIVGSGPKMSELLTLVERVAPTNQTVLIQGESGTGKELIARRVHRLSPRRNRPFVLVDCASLNKHLLETELFGHEKGAFTGADGVKHGLIEAAHTGTLFVDEVGSLDPEMQSDFLRMLETQEYRRVGGTTTRQADLRIVAATNTDLWEATRQGRFREDLFFRLSVIVLTVPPLRKRKEDIPVLAEYFLERIDYGDKPKYLSPEVLESLTDYDWPGNVRELRNVIERTALLSDGEVVEPTDLRMLPTVAERIIKLLTEDDQLVTLRELQSRYIRYVLGKVKGHQQQASKILDIDPKTIYRNIRKD